MSSKTGKTLKKMSNAISFVGVTSSVCFGLHICINHKDIFIFGFLWMFIGSTLMWLMGLSLYAIGEVTEIMANLPDEINKAVENKIKEKKYTLDKMSNVYFNYLF